MALNDPNVINIKSTEVGAEMFDKLNRIKAGRRIKPLSYHDNIQYAHRSYFADGYHLQIGDTCFIIPPEFIMVSSESTSQSIVMLRQENTQKMKSGHHRRTILIDLVFNGTEQLNGYPVKGPEGIYYMDGLRQLLAQFKCTPFLPIINETINGAYEIFSVALQSITMSTINGFPGAMTAQITLQEVSMVPYIEMPDPMLYYTIDWDLFRFYYQRMLTENHEYKKLQSLPYNKEHNRFKISILDSSVLESGTATKKNILKLITDKDIVRTNEDGSLCDTNYVAYIDSDIDDVTISSFQCGYSNILTNIQLSDIGSPTVQFLGGMDTIYNIVFETTDASVVQALETCQINNDVLTRNHIKLRSVGFVKLESELVEFTGSLFVAIESVASNTVPGFPGLYAVQINCVSYDIGQSEREQLNGFMPFDGDGRKDQAIEQSWDGLKIKVKQDNYAEWKIRTTMEVYPDLHLPTYAETNEFIKKCIKFRADNGLAELPYNDYPTNPISMLHGNKNGTQELSGNLCHPCEVDSSLYEYNIFVDPDFYVFYPNTYLSFMQDQEDGEDYYGYKPKHRSGYSKTKVINNLPDYTGAGGANATNDLAKQFVQLACTQIGKQYVWGAAGPNTFDCSGFVTWCLKEIGVMPANQGRLTVTTITTSDLFTEVSYEDRKEGDVICVNNLNHVVICEGNGTVVHASNSNPYPKGGVKESPEDYYSSDSSKRVFRAKAFIANTSANEASEQAVSSGRSVQQSSSSDGPNDAKTYAILKQYGMTDVCTSGIMGNFGTETGGTFDPRIVQSKPPYKYSDTIPTESGIGYGLPQYTYGPYKTGLKQWCEQNGVGVNTREGQIGYMMSLISGTSWYRQMNQINSVEEATKIFLMQFEKPKNPSASINQRIKYATDAYSKFAGQFSGGTNTNASNNEIDLRYVMSSDEFDSICRYVQAEVNKEGYDAAQGVAQYIFDQVTDTDIGLGVALTPAVFKNGLYEGDLSESIRSAVKSVFCEDKKAFPQKIKAFINLCYGTGERGEVILSHNAVYKNLGTKGNGVHIFYGDKDDTESVSVKYTISDTEESTMSKSGGVEVQKVNYKEVTLTEDDLKYFAEPVLARTEYMRYGENAHQTFSKDELNSGKNIFLTSFCDMYQFSGKGRLVRAFPAYLFCVLDDQAQWFDGKKLWANYYTHRSVVDISIHETNDMPTATATVVISNSYHNLDITQGGLSKYKVSEDPEYMKDDALTGFRKWWYKTTSLMPGLKGPKITDKLIELHSIMYETARLREDSRVHLRIGYGSDPLSLAPVMNGRISDITLGDQINMVITSDGAELIQHITSKNETGKKDTNNGWFGLFGLGENQEASDIIAKIMSQRASWVNHLCLSGTGYWFENSKYGIEHYGLYISQNLFGINGEGVINNAWAKEKEQYDLLKNIYTSSYIRDHYVTCDWFIDKEKNVVFNKCNMTPWDVFQVCTQQAPEYIVKSSYHQFDSRLYYGCPTWMEKFRYNMFGNELWEECKASTQCHFIDSLTSIIDNQVMVTSKFTNTNIKVMYTLGNTVQPTKLLHSDDTIDFAYQKTTIMDSPVVQDALGPDKLYEILGYELGYKSAKRIGISNLLYGWQQQYQGQLILMGEPGIKAHDYILLNDGFASMHGVCIAREVIHSFNTNTGFTTSVVPGMIGFSTTEESGLIVSSQNMLMILNMFSAFIESRRMLVRNYEQYINVFADFFIMEQIYNDALKRYKDLEFWHTAENIAGTVAILGTTFLLLRAVKKIGGFVRIAKVGVQTFKSFKNITKGVSTLMKVKKIYQRCSMAVKATASSTGWGIIAAVAISLIIDNIIDAILEWLENKNLICLLPMWWNDYPFVCNIKDGEHILLIDSNARAAEEQDGSASIELDD